MVTALLLIFTGILHVITALFAVNQTFPIAIMTFGGFYSIIGLMLLFRNRLAPILGIVFPLLGLLSGILVMGISNWTTMLYFLFAFDIVVIAGNLILTRKKTEIL